MDYCLLLSFTLSFALVFGVPLTLLFLLGSSLLPEESQAFKVFVEAHPAGGELDNILRVSLADLLVLFGFKDSEFLLLYPLSIELSFLGSDLLLEGVADLNSLAFVVLLQGQGFGFLRFGLDSRFLIGLLLSLWDFGCRLVLLLFDVFIFFELILDVAHVAPSSAFLPGLISKNKDEDTLCLFHSSCRDSAPLLIFWTVEWVVLEYS